MKNTTKIAITSVISVTITILAFRAYLFLTQLPFELSSPYLMILTKPGFKYGRIYLYQEGFQDRNVSLCIPPSNKNNSLKRVASWECNAWEAVWSKDGSVLAMKLNDYFLAYDFNSGQSIPNQKIVSVVDLDPQISQQIRNLIDERGGYGTTIPCSTSAFVQLRYSKWKKFRTALMAGKYID